MREIFLIISTTTAANPHRTIGPPAEVAFREYLYLSVIRKMDGWFWVMVGRAGGRGKHRGGFLTLPETDSRSSCSLRRGEETQGFFKYKEHDVK